MGGNMFCSFIFPSNSRELVSVWSSHTCLYMSKLHSHERNVTTEKTSRNYHLMKVSIFWKRRMYNLNIETFQPRSTTQYYFLSKFLFLTCKPPSCKSLWEYRIQYNVILLLSVKGSVSNQECSQSPFLYTSHQSGYHLGASLPHIFFRTNHLFLTVLLSHWYISNLSNTLIWSESLI